MTDWKAVRAAQENLGIEKHLTLSQFREAWVSVHGEPQSSEDEAFLEGKGLESFYEDYLTSTAPNVWAYLRDR